MSTSIRPAFSLIGLLRLVMVIGAIALLILAAAAGIGALMRSSQVYQGALERVRADPEVVAALGEPIRPGLFTVGSIETTGLSGEASINAAIRGSQRRGMMYVGARRENGVWNYYTLAVSVRGTDKVIVVNQ